MRSFRFLLIIVFMYGCNTGSDSPLIIGHRGAMGYETENSIASIEKALELGVDMIEIDVFRIRSGEIAVFHDEKVDRLTNGEGYIEDYYMLEMKRLSLDGGHQIPILQDVLKTIDNKAALNIELKGAGTANRVQYITEYYSANRGWDRDNFLISSFNWDELKAYRELSPEGRIAVLTEGDPLEALEVARELKAEAINPHFSQLNADKVAQIHQAGFKVYTWTVNDADTFRQLEQMGVDGVFSDFPDKME